MDQEKERCTCGNTTVEYYPEENQHVPACWDCYEQRMDELYPPYVDEDHTIQQWAEGIDELPW